jgi:phosphoribosylanthranilate isomerase
LRENAHENVKALREAMGSATRALSTADLAALITKEHPDRNVSASTVQRWELDVEPDFESVAIMARMAKVTFEQFARGTRGRPVGQMDKSDMTAVPPNDHGDKRDVK